MQKKAAIGVEILAVSFGAQLIVATRAKSFDLFHMQKSTVGANTAGPVPA